MTKAWTTGMALLLTGLAGAQTITLRDETFVSGGEVLLGDVAQIEGTDAEWLRTVPVARAAGPGRSTRVDAALIASRLRREGLDPAGLEFKGPARSLATTLAYELTPTELERDLRRHLESAMPWGPSRAEVSVQEFTRGAVVRDGIVSIEWHAPPDFAWLGTGTFRGDVRVDGETEATVYGRVDIKAYADVFVAATEIPRGGLLTSAAVRREARQIGDAREQPILDPAQLEGQVARTRIRAGQTIAASDLEPRAVVKRNQFADVEAKSGALTIRLRARVMADGAVGDVVECENVASRQRFTAYVRPDGILEVL